MSATHLPRLAVAIVLSLAALALVVPAATAHPLGNFTINHYNGLRVGVDGVVIDHVTDYAEIPTFSERRVMDTDGDGELSDAEAATYQSTSCGQLSETLNLTVDGHRVALKPTHSGLHFALGQGSQVMRLVCVFRGSAAIAASGSAFEFRDLTYAERRGWREIVVQGDATTPSDGDAPTASVSERLTAYPSELLALPLNQSTISFTARPGGPALAAPEYPDATPLGAAVAPLATAGQAPAAVPGGTTDLGADVTALFQAPDLTPPLVALSLLVAVALGALHALSPGHGKTVMAAYLVGSRGNVRQAVGLGLTVTFSHTLGVLALGALSLSAAAIIPVDRLYPVLALVAGSIVIVIGAYLLLSRLRQLRPAAAPHHGHEHKHGHDHPHDHKPVRPAGWHEHDGVGHTHLPQPGMGRRGLFALGLSGGMVPSVSALLVLLGSISLGRPAYGIVLTVAFGIGMAAVLVGVGLALVYARQLVERLPVRAPFGIGQRLPVLTAAIVVIAGVFMLGQGLSGLA